MVELHPALKFYYTRDNNNKAWCLIIIIARVSQKQKRPDSQDIIDISATRYAGMGKMVGLTHSNTPDVDVRTASIFWIRHDWGKRCLSCELHAQVDLRVATLSSLGFDTNWAFRKNRSSSLPKVWRSVDLTFSTALPEC